MTTEHRGVALGNAENRRKGWITAEIKLCRLKAQHEIEAAARAAAVEREPAR
jgi:hypothetical protein